MTIEEIKGIAAHVCRQYKVKRLYLFGSLSRGEGNDQSDIDLLVEFDSPDSNLSKRFFGLLHFFEDTLGCHVDLLTLKSLKNPYLSRKVLKERINIYEG